MEKYAWRGKIVPGMQEEYKKRHDNIWPEMKEVLANAGIVNYSIWMQGEELFGYYECEKGVDYAAKVQAESDVVKKWDEYMKDILIMEKDPVTGAQPLLTQVFSFRQRRLWISYGKILSGRGYRCFQWTTYFGTPGERQNRAGRDLSF